MRTLYFLVPLVTGCVIGGPSESRGVTAGQHSGSVPVALVNATPEKICSLYMAFDTDTEYGDNWLPEGGLAVGATVDFKVKPGTYKAKWSSCNDARVRPTVNYAATLFGGTAIQLDEPIQLYAFVSDGVPPTKRAVPRPRVKLVKFIGQTTEITAYAD